ncbi:MAG: isochorismate synthase [Verrucomicrobiota bacterium]|nr:isochorismate synthase [Verrucomicrobiota bacterium]
MSFSVSVLPPSSCDEHTDLTPFVESLITRAKSHHQSHFLSVTIETDYSDPLAILEEIHQVDTPICYLEKPANEFSIAAGDYLTVARFSGVNRFHEARAWADLTLNNTVVAGDHKIPGTGPTLFLTATFENDSVNPDNPPPLEIFLPRWQVVRKEGFNFLTLNIEIQPQSSTEYIVGEFEAHISKIRGLRYDSSNALDPKSVKVSKPTENYDYEEGVIKALDEIKKQNLSKIVLSRQLTFPTDSMLPTFSIAHGLREKFSDCHTFCISQPNRGLMVGATPETLLRTSGNSFETEALAGSAPRGVSAGKDALWGKTLLGREKEILEHNLVIQSIVRRLSSIGINNCKEGKPRLLRLANLQHAKTPLRVSPVNDIHPFEVLSALHPTPAMGGTPREVALPLVNKIEKVSRGWYSGITGWIDNRGRGEFVVPIRCGKIASNKLTLYAGAGLVEGSIAKQEKKETDWKLQAMLEVITGSTSLPES